MTYRAALRRLYRVLRSNRRGAILDLWVSTEPPSDALFDALARRLLARRSITRW